MTQRIAILDFETTGMSPAHGARAAEVGIVLIEAGRIVDRFQSLMNAGQGMPAFITAMNTKARALGMHNSRFADPTGLSSGNVSTAHDLARMVAAAHRYPLIRKWSTTAETAIEVDGQQQVFRNTNPLVNNSDWAVGLSKTGFIHEAGRCLVMQAWLAEKPVVIVLLDSAGKLTRVGDANRIKRWMEYTQNLTQKAPTHASASAGKAG